jgi:hypothetical protein
MPSSSARTMTYPRKTDKLHFYHELKTLRDEIKHSKKADDENDKHCDELDPVAST